MSSLLDKPVNFQRSISAKLNPQDQKFKILKQAGYFNRQFSFRTKNLDLPSKSSIQDSKIFEKQDQRFLLSKNITTKLFKNVSQNEKSKKSSKNLHNPFDYLTDSSVKKNNFQESQKLKQAQIKIKQLSTHIDNLNQQLSQTQLKGKKTQQEGNRKNQALSLQLSKLKSQIQLLNEQNQQLLLKQKILFKENENLKLTIQQIKDQKESSQYKPQNNQNDSLKFRLLGKQYEKKINDLYEENYKLKNIYNSLEGKFQQNQTIVQSLQKMNEMLQKRFINYERQSSLIKQQLRDQNSKLKEQLLTLKEQKQLVQSENQMLILKLENQIFELKRQNVSTEKEYQEQSSQNMVKNLPPLIQTINNKKLHQIIQTLQMAFKQQIDETSRLKEKNKKLTKIVSQIHQ